MPTFISLTHEVAALLTNYELSFIERTLKRFPLGITLTQLWMVIDEVWEELKCDPSVSDHQIAAFYSHPVWILNALFSMQDRESVRNREEFARFAKSLAPSRIADFGGGFGSLGVMLTRSLPEASITIVEPNVHLVARAMLTGHERVKFANSLSDEYDLILAVDVFEHVFDPCSVVLECSRNLRVGGCFLIANCFEPVMKCHLDQNLHYHFSWEHIMCYLGFEPGERVAYGRVYYKVTAKPEFERVRLIIKVSRLVYPVLRLLPRGKFFVASFIFNLFRRL